MNINPTYAEVRYPNGREATVYTRHLSSCTNVINEVVNCNETLESDVTENDSNVAVDSGENITEPSGDKIFTENNIILLKLNVRWSNCCNIGAHSSIFGFNY